MNIIIIYIYNKRIEQKGNIFIWCNNLDSNKNIENYVDI